MCIRYTVSRTCRQIVGRPAGRRYCFFATLLLACAACWAQPGASPAPQAAAKPALQLNLRQAVDLALGPEGNARVRLAEEFVRQARARSAQARAALLPSIESSFGQQNLTRNLEAFGIRIYIPVPGFVFPTFVGPFNVFDARATVSQLVFDMSSIRRFQASRAGMGLAEAEKEAAEDQVRDRVARTYLAALRSEASVEAANANVRLAEALLKLAGDQKMAGTATGIELTRAKVHLANENQRALVVQNERTRVYLELLRAVGLDLDTTLDLTEKLSFVPIEGITLERALKVALDARADWKAQQKRLESAELNQSATKLERLPSAAVFADYGTIGSSIHRAIPTRTYGFAVRVPIFDGGRRDARRAESASQSRQEQIRTRDLRAQMETEIRVALDNLRSAAEQVRTAEEGLLLAGDEVAQAERRYRAGAGGNIELTDAQTRLARARENKISALFNHNLARFDLNSAMGTIRLMIQ